SVAEVWKRRCRPEPLRDRAHFPVVRLPETVSTAVRTLSVPATRRAASSGLSFLASRAAVLIIVPSFTSCVRAAARSRVAFAGFFATFFAFRTCARTLVTNFLSFFLTGRETSPLTAPFTSPASAVRRQSRPSKPWLPGRRVFWHPCCGSQSLRVQASSSSH